MTSVNIDFSTISKVTVKTVYVAKALRTHASISVDFDTKAFCSGDLCNLLLYGESRPNLHMSHIILESTLHFINQTKRFKKQADKNSVSHHLIETI